MDEPTERLLDYDGGQLYVRDDPGRTPAIVAMHGFPDDSRIYDWLIDPLDPQRVVTFDWIGYGVIGVGAIRRNRAPSAVNKSSWPSATPCNSSRRC